MTEAESREMQLICVHAPPVSDEWIHYTRYIAGLLGVEPVYRPAPGPVSAHDVVLLYEPAPPRWQQALGRTPSARLAMRGPASILVVRHLRWPLTRLLLLFRGGPADAAAIAWTRALACPAAATVTVLPILPPIPALYAPPEQGRPATAPLLAANTPAAAHLRRLAAQLASWQVPAAIHLEWGEPAWQMRTELAGGGYDLVLAAAEPAGRLYRFLVGDLVGPLLRCANCPVLVAHNTPGRNVKPAGSSRLQTGDHLVPEWAYA